MCFCKVQELEQLPEVENYPARLHGAMQSCSLRVCPLREVENHLPDQTHGPLKRVPSVYTQRLLSIFCKTPVPPYFISGDLLGHTVGVGAGFDRIYFK